VVVDIRDVITCFKFGDDRFRGLPSAEGQILPFPIDFDGRPYNTLTLPCERVMTFMPTLVPQRLRRDKLQKHSQHIYLQTMQMLVTYFIIIVHLRLARLICY